MVLLKHGAIVVWSSSGNSRSYDEIGRTISYVDIPEEDARRGMKTMGLFVIS